MNLQAYNGTMTGHRPWALTQNQRGPTCGMTAISVAYRILTGWTIFATKGQFRDFNKQLFLVDMQKGDEDAYVLRKAAKDLHLTQAGEIVNADSLLELLNLCEGVSADIVELQDSHDVGARFVSSVRADIKAGYVPIVLFHVGILGGGQYKPARGEKYQHWVAIFGVEENNAWCHATVKNLSPQTDLTFPDGVMTADAMLVWNWGRPFVVGGEALGRSSALSIDWVSGRPRMWMKDESKEMEGKLKWNELTGSDDNYVVDSTAPNVRYTQEAPSRSLDLRGYVRVRAT